MSRIHEALKRAEQERAAGQGRQGEPLPLPVSSAAPELSAPSMAMPALSSSYALEALLARCPQMDWKPDKKTMLFFNAQEQVCGAEEFRTLRSRLYQIREKQNVKKVLVTSALPKEGKSFVAANLAQVMVRQHGRRALLIDADLRGARLHLALGTSSTPGLSDYLMGEIDEFGAIQRGPMENLFFIPSGREISNPAELVANGRLRTLLNQIEPVFDWIIVDSPPAVPVSDASLLANYCDGVLIVVRSNETPSDIARKARQEFPERALLGVVLNGIEAESSPYSQYYYGAYGRPQTKERGEMQS
ncbi:MAG TPA: CpsD/CapB family tyrosine-protein kinase [Terriglobales bacterium]|jgi:capsular exopolysaccharide synthesis family protein